MSVLTEEEYREVLDNCVLSIIRNDKPENIKSEYFGYLLNRLCEAYVNAHHSQVMFNTINQNTGLKKQVDDLSLKLIASFNREKPESFLKLVFTLWCGVCGDHPESNNSFNFYCLTLGAIEQIKVSLSQIKFTHLSPNDVIISSRRLMMLRGILNLATSEMFVRWKEHV